MGKVEPLQCLLQWGLPDAETGEGCGTGRKRRGFRATFEDVSFGVHSWHDHQYVSQPYIFRTSDAALPKAKTVSATALNPKVAGI